MNRFLNLSQWIKCGALMGLCSLPVIARDIRYDAAGRVAWSIQPSGQTTTFKYDANGNIEAIASITPAEDTDADGMPDYFEIQFAGNTTGLMASEDSDQDGMNYLFEFAFAKDPSVSDGPSSRGQSAPSQCFMILLLFHFGDGLHEATAAATRHQHRTLV